MTSVRRILALAGGLLVVLFSAGCANMSECERDTAIGATLGGVAGSVLSEACRPYRVGRRSK